MCMVRPHTLRNIGGPTNEPEKRPCFSAAKDGTNTIERATAFVLASAGREPARLPRRRSLDSSRGKEAVPRVD
jgi:hypothetical protein